jgi:hypothetical protein
MPCTDRYSEAWRFAAFFCVEAIVSNVDDSGGAANAFLTDSQVDFVQLGVQASVGMVLYNTTQNTNGQVTAVTAHTITATGVTWDDGDAYIIVAIDAQQRATIELNLNLAATMIHAARAQSGGCDCTLASWADDYLAHLNVVIAAAFYSCTCGRPSISALSDETRTAYREWAQEQLNAIRDVRIELCDGETGSETPVLGWAEQGTTEFARAQIILNDLLRNS